MTKLPFTKEELISLYESELDSFLDQCDWVTYIDSPTVCLLVSNALKGISYDIGGHQKLYEKYSKKVATLNLTKQEWADTYDIRKIIGLIYGILEAN